DLIFGDSAQRSRQAHTRIREQYIDASKLLADMSDGTLYLQRIAHIGAQRSDAISKFTCGRFQTVGILADDDHRCSFLLEQFCSFESNARRAAGNENDFVREPHDLLLI